MGLTLWAGKAFPLYTPAEGTGGRYPATVLLVLAIAAALVAATNLAACITPCIASGPSRGGHWLQGTGGRRGSGGDGGDEAGRLPQDFPQSRFSGGVSAVQHVELVNS